MSDKMIDQEVNKIIAEFMEGQVVNDVDYFHDFIIYKLESGKKTASSLYTESLDALVPVWEKLGKMEVSRSIIKLDFIHKKAFIPFTKYMAKGNTLEEAAANVTAQFISELNND